MRDRLSRAEGQIKIGAERASQLEAALEQARSQTWNLERKVQQLSDQVGNGACFANGDTAMPPRRVAKSHGIINISVTFHFYIFATVKNVQRLFRLVGTPRCEVLSTISLNKASTKSRIAPRGFKHVGIFFRAASCTVLRIRW